MRHDQADPTPNSPPCDNVSTLAGGSFSTLTCDLVPSKPAIEWVMERQAVTTGKDSGIVKDTNNWAIETVGDPRYPLSLLLRVITVSLETMKIVKGLPTLVLEGD